MSDGREDVQEMYAATKKDHADDSQDCTPRKAGRTVPLGVARLRVLRLLLLAVLGTTCVHVGLDLMLRGVHSLWADESRPADCLLDDEVRNPI